MSTVVTHASHSCTSSVGFVFHVERIPTNSPDNNWKRQKLLMLRFHRWGCSHYVTEIPIKYVPNSRNGDLTSVVMFAN